MVKNKIFKDIFKYYLLSTLKIKSIIPSAEYFSIASVRVRKFPVDFDI